VRLPKATRQDLASAFIERHVKETGQLPTVRQVHLAVGGRTGTIAAVLRGYRHGLAHPEEGKQQS
jgi:hypothetical protein